MVIQSLEKKYTVIEAVFADEQLERYLCRGENGEEQYTVVCVRDRSWIRKAMRFLVEQTENTCFTDFVSCFFSGSYLYIVMKYAEGNTLAEKLADEDCPLAERLETGKRILEKILLLNMPDYFLWDCLRPETVVVSPSQEASFRYRLSELDQYGMFGFREAQDCLGGLLEALFARELGQNMLPPVCAFCRALHGGEYEGMQEVYAVYAGVCADVQTMLSGDAVSPHTWSFRLWDRITRYFVLCRKIAACLLMALALLFLLFSVRNALEEGRQKTVFESIGTLRVR